MNPPAIDTGSLLTMLGIIAAVWALVPATAKLSFRLSFTWLDWLLIWAGALGIHVLVFEQVLRAVGLYPVLGPWIWGFDKSGLLYLLFLGLAVYVYARARTTRLSRRSLPLFEQLATSLLHARKFDELGDLLARHLETVLDIAAHHGVRGRLADWLRPSDRMPRLTFVATRLAIEPAPQPRWSMRVLGDVRARLSRAVGPNVATAERARSIARTLLASRGLVGYLARAHPYLCLRVMDRAESLVEDFQDEYFEALLADEASVFFVELKNNHNLRGGHRLLIPAENRLLSFYLSDVNTAAKLGVYRSLGEAVISTISFDRELVDRLNGPLITYMEVGRHRCPIASGIHFFRIMVLEGLHQRIFDHLWLHYVTHFVGRILEHARELRAEDDLAEFPTPFCYLLYEIVDATTDWIEEATRVTEPGDVVTRDQREGHHIRIAFEAAEALSGVMLEIMLSTKLTNRLKGELLTLVLRSHTRVRSTARLAPLARAVEQAMVRPYGMQARDGYLETLERVYSEQDHVLRAETRSFYDAIRAELDQVAHR